MTHARIGKKIPPGFSLDIDLAIPAGVTALYGPPGAGKTLTLEMIAGFVTPDSGRILLEDAILFDAESRVNIPPRRRRCGFLCQRDALFPHMTVRQNLVFAARRLPRLERHRKVAEMVERFGLSEAAAGRPRDASRALKLRASVARALIAEPKLLLVDDCGVDEPLLRQIREACPAPIVLVAPSLDLCCAAGELVILDAGRVVERGSPREVLDRPDSVQAARLLGIPNILECTIAALDPGRNTSRLEFERFALAAPYLPGHLRGDRVWVAIRAEDLRVRAAGGEPPVNVVPASLVRATPRERSVRLEFAGPIFVDLSQAEYARQKDNKEWLVEFPPEALTVL